MLGLLAARNAAVLPRGPAPALPPIVAARSYHSSRSDEIAAFQPTMDGIVYGGVIDESPKYKPPFRTVPASHSAFTAERGRVYSHELERLKLAYEAPLRAAWQTVRTEQEALKQRRVADFIRSLRKDMQEYKRRDKARNNVYADLSQFREGDLPPSFPYTSTGLVNAIESDHFTEHLRRWYVHRLSRLDAVMQAEDLPEMLVNGDPLLWSLLSGSPMESQHRREIQSYEYNETFLDLKGPAGPTGVQKTLLARSYFDARFKMKQLGLNLRPAEYKDLSVDVVNEEMSKEILDATTTIGPPTSPRAAETITKALSGFSSEPADTSRPWLKPLPPLAFSLETSNYVISNRPGKLKKERHDLMQRKVIGRLHVPSFHLPPAVEARFIALAGPRYDPATRVVSIVADQENHQVRNRRRVKDLIRALLTEAFLVHPSFVPLHARPALPMRRELHATAVTPWEYNEYAPPVYTTISVAPW